MKVLVTGGAGLVATHLLRVRPPGVEAEVTWRHAAPPAGVVAHRCELASATEVDDLLAGVAPDVVVHTAYSMGRRADIVDASTNVAAACAASGAALVHLSSDVVFDGEHPPYSEGDEPAPVTDYGRWKLAAESAVLDRVPDACITRTSLIVSLDPPDRGTRWLLDAVRAGERPTLFHDEIRSAIRAEDLARTIWALVGLDRQERAGVWHLPGPEALSRAEVGRRVLVAAGVDPSVAVEASVRDHPDPRPPDLALVSRRDAPGPAPSPVP